MIDSISKTFSSTIDNLLQTQDYRLVTIVEPEVIYDIEIDYYFSANENWRIDLFDEVKDFIDEIELDQIHKFYNRTITVKHCKGNHYKLNTIISLI